MSDRELLELAAKAAGYKFLKYHEEHGMSGPWAEINKPAPESCTSRWNPIVNDGDALRLAVKLGLVVCMMKDAGLTGVYIPAEHIGGKYDAGETYYLTDPCAATRRAIVRAAAGIGRSMP